MLGQDVGIIDLFWSEEVISCQMLCTYVLSSHCEGHLNWPTLLQFRNCILKSLPVDRSFGVMLLRDSQLHVPCFSQATTYIRLIVNRRNLEVRNRPSISP